MNILGKHKKAIIAVLFLTFISVIIAINTIGGVPSFDGAMNVQIAENLIKNGTYSVNYPQGSLFDVKIQTGVTVNLPTAIILNLFGKSLGNSVIINIVYIIALFISMAILFKIMHIKEKWILLILTVFLFTPYFFEYSTGLYGETVMLVWIILSIIFLERNEKCSNKYFLLSGILYGIAYLTKTVALIGIPAIVVVFIYRLKTKKDININNILIWGIGFISPIILFELYKLIQMGLHGYYLSWRELFHQILTESGVKEGEVDTSNKVLKLFKHIQIFANNFKINAVIFVILLLSNFGTFCHRIYKERNMKYADILSLISFSYFGWWLIITTDARAWPRRIIIGVLLMEILTLWNALYLAQYLKINKVKENILTTVAILAVALMIAFNIKDMLGEMNNRIEDKKSIIKAADEIKNIGNDTEFLGFGWWQAPVLAFQSDKIFGDYYEVKNQPVKKDTYLVVDRYAKLLANNELESVLSNIDSELIYSDDKYYNYIYRIKEFLPYKEFTESEINKVTENTYNMRDNYDYFRGVYDYEKAGDLRWSSQNSCLLLKNNLQTNNLKLNISYQIRDYQKFIDKEPTLKILVNNNEVYSKVITEDGIYNESIDIKDIVKQDQVAQIKFKFSTRLNAEGDGRQLAFVVTNTSLTK